MHMDLLRLAFFTQHHVLEVVLIAVEVLLIVVHTCNFLLVSIALNGYAEACPTIHQLRGI